jgi:hypothetical protein
MPALELDRDVEQCDGEPPVSVVHDAPSVPENDSRQPPLAALPSRSLRSRSRGGTGRRRAASAPCAASHNAPSTTTTRKCAPSPGRLLAELDRSAVRRRR